MNILISIFEPLKKGKVSKNPRIMKESQNLLSVFVSVAALVAALVPSIQPYLSEDVIIKLFAAYSAINLYLTTASSEKVGV
jgi:hypothetical protein